MTSQTTTTQDSEELARFRERWREEVRQRRFAVESAGRASEQDIDSSAAQPESPNQPFIFPAPISPKKAGRVDDARTTNQSAGSTSRFLTTIASNPAVATYRDAVKYEEQGDYDTAIRLYRQAFRQDPNVDRAYFTAEKIAQKASSLVSAHKPMEQLAKDMKKMTVHDTHHPDNVGTGSLEELVSSYPDGIRFEPEDEKQGEPALNAIPEELLLHILKFMDTVTLERFAAACRKARLLTLDSTVWQDLVLKTYKPPQISLEITPPDLLEKFAGDWRRLYVEQPRVRTDGVYIAVCHYVRAGMSENHWVNISHVITYHRYLRFYANGQVLSLLANEEFNPQQVIPLLKPTLRMKGFYVGEWRLEDETVYINNLFDASGQYHVPGSDIPATEPTHGHHRHHSAQPQPLKYVFQMRLRLSSKPMAGRWNRLELTEYDSVDVNSGEACAMSLKHDRPFWFSKVRSYAASA